MKIQFFHSKAGGPAVFMRRLRHYLVDHFDVKITNIRPDIYLSAVWRGDPPKCAKTIHRVDNCYFNTMYDIGGNRGIRKAICKADFVVYQSDFSVKLCYGILDIMPKEYAVIYNGFDQSVCRGIQQYNHSYNHVFVACALWRPIKRPLSIMRAFENAKLPNSVLIMIGSGLKKYKSKNIICTGKLKEKDTFSYYKAASAIIHISRMESCPNTIVEALSFGKPVICNNAGGSPEIVRGDGVVVNIDPPDTFMGFPMKSPDTIDVSDVSSAIRNVVNVKWNISRPDLDMYSCAKKYYDIFTKILS